MSYDQSSNPYGSPAANEISKPMGEPPLRYMYAYQYIFENPNWLMNIILAGLFVLIPAIGPIILWGYMFVVVEYLLRRQGPSYPDFDFGRFSDYLMRGIWIFVVSMIVNLVLTPVMLVMIYGPMICGGIAAGAVAENGNEAVGGICVLVSMLLMFIGIMAMSILSALVILPMVLAAGLSQELGPAFNFAFIKDFASKMWKEVLLVFLFVMVASQVLSLLGMMLLCVGIIPAGGIIALSYAHFLSQFYEIYLARGGMPIPLKEMK